MNFPAEPTLRPGVVVSGDLGWVVGPSYPWAKTQNTIGKYGNSPVEWLRRQATLRKFVALKHEVGTMVLGSLMGQDEGKALPLFYIYINSPSR